VDTAVAAIQSVGGQVTSDLWLIDAAGAVVEQSQLTQLADYPGIVSIVDNKGLATAQATDSAYQWEGWVTDRRNYHITHPLDGTVTAPMTTLKDGGVFVILITGEGYILNADGTLRTTINLEGSQYDSPLGIAPEGTIYITGKDRLYSLNPDGTENWFQAPGQTQRFIGLTLGSDAVFVVNDKRTVFAYNRHTGQEMWRYDFASLAGFNKVAPAVGPDGTVFAVSQNGYVAAINPTTGIANWTFIPASSGTYRLQPLVHSDGTVFVVDESGPVYAINPDGSQKYQFTANSHIIGQPTLANDGALFVVSQGVTDGPPATVYGLNADGSVRFATPHVNGHFATKPILSLDETKLFVANKNNQLLAFDTANGSLLWVHDTNGQLKAPPALAANGNLHLGDLVGTYEIITPEGLVVYRYGGFADFRVTPTLSHDGSVFFHDDKARIVVLSRIPDDWHETVPHVEATDDPQVYKVASPLSIDLGADVAHMNGVTGAGIGVAVIDSGVYFDQHTQDTLGANVQSHFLGQANFVGAGTCAETTPGTCFTDYTNSQDGFGHGSHVAGIIWNNVRDYYTGAVLGIAPDANVLSVRVLNDDGMGTYEDVIEGIQYVVANKDIFDIRVINMSLSAHATTPYFVDPMNRAVEAAWAAGIVVVAAAGNEGPQAETITVPGNDPYVITVGAVDSNRTPGYWADDTIRDFSSTGPTLDGFVKPDVIAPGGNIVSYMYNDGDTDPATSNSPKLVLNHPDYSVSGSMFRMNGTSMSTAVASGVVALMLDADPTLTPDQVKFRMLYTARTVVNEDDEAMMSVLQQGVGRIWVPDTLFSDLPLESANTDMDINADLAHGWLALDGDGNPILDVNGEPVLDETELDFHYIGPVQRTLSDDGTAYLYYVEDPDDITMIEPLGISRLSDNQWLDTDGLNVANLTFNNGEITWDNGYIFSGGRYSWAGGRYSWAGGRYSWAGGRYSWAGGRYSWAGGRYSWAGGRYSWAGGRYSWAGGRYSWAGGRYSWAGGTPWLDTAAQSTSVSSTTWVGDDGGPTAVSLQNIQIESHLPWLAASSAIFFALSVVSVGLYYRRRQP